MVTFERVFLREAEGAAQPGEQTVSQLVSMITALQRPPFSYYSLVFKAMPGSLMRDSGLKVQGRMQISRMMGEVQWRR